MHFLEAFGSSKMFYVKCIYVELAQAEVRDLDVTFLVDQDVVGFEVSVDVVHFVDRLDCQDLGDQLIPLRRCRTYLLFR